MRATKPKLIRRILHATACAAVKHQKREVEMPVVTVTCSHKEYCRCDAIRSKTTRPVQRTSCKHKRQCRRAGMNLKQRKVSAHESRFAGMYTRMTIRVMFNDIRVAGLSRPVHLAASQLRCWSALTGQHAAGYPPLSAVLGQQPIEDCWLRVGGSKEGLCCEGLYQNGYGYKHTTTTDPVRPQRPV